MKQRSISLKAYHCPQTGREIHYSFAHLRAGSSIHDNTTNARNSGSSSQSSSNINNDTACWVFFYPAGPNRRLLEAVISRYEGEFECCHDVIFLCLNRPGKGGSSSSFPGNHHAGGTNHEQLSLEQEYIHTACNDVVTIINYYNILKVHLLYMCAGSTFAYSFAAQYAERTTGYIVGLSSWILRHDGDKLNTNNNGKHDCSSSTSSSDIIIDCATPTNMNSTIHSIAMRGYLGPKSIISSLAGNIISSIAPNVFNLFPPQWIVDGFKKELSVDEQVEFDAQFPNDGGVDFVELMRWMYDDGDGDGSVFVNIDGAEAAAELNHDKQQRRVPNMNDGNAKDIAVCLSSQHDLGLEYKSSIPKQKRVLLYHGENDKMVNVVGAEYLESMLSHATLSYVSEGTHQGTMFFFPRDVMLELNQISSLKQD
jgi:pimeloyl-ACP methyl ester carboxylesterase